jgi:hypothetical protein
MYSDINYFHSSEIYVLRACHNDDATDLVAIGSDCGVDVFQIVSLILILLQNSRIRIK